MFTFEKLKIYPFILIFFISMLTSLGLMAQGTHDERKTEAYWLEEIELDSTKALNYFNLGVLQQQKNQYASAIENYNKAINLKSPLAPVALFYIARAYESLGKNAEAQKTITSINIDSVPPTLKNKVLEYKNKLFAANMILDGSDTNNAETKSDEKSLSLYLELSRGQNSNPDIYADTQSGSIVADTQTQLRSGLDYLAWASALHDIKLSYFYSGTQFDKTSASNYLSHEFSIPISFYFGSSRIKIKPEYSQDYYSGSLFSETKGAEASYTIKFQDDFFNIGFESLNIDNKTTSYSYLSGRMQKYFISYESRWTHSKITNGLYLSDYKYQDTTTLASSYSSYIYGLSYSYYQSSFDFSVSLNLEGRQYNKAASNSSSRLDFKTSASAQVGYTFGASVRLFLDANYIKNKSNFDTTTDDRNYQQSIYSLGINWAY